jgi:hypothetical protein
MTNQATSDFHISLAAELLLLAIDPEKGGLLPRRRRRFRRALAATHGSAGRGRRLPGAGRRACRHAARELEGLGLVERRRPVGRLRLADRTLAAKRFQPIRRGLVDDDIRDPRTLDLALLLAWTGLLGHRLTRNERRMAARRLRKLVRDPRLSATREAAFPGEAPTPEWVGAVGRIAFEAQEGLLIDVVSDLGSGDLGGFDPSDFGGVDVSSGAGGDGGADGR